MPSALRIFVMGLLSLPLMLLNFIVILSIFRMNTLTYAFQKIFQIKKLLMTILHGLRKTLHLFIVLPLWGFLLLFQQNIVVHRKRKTKWKYFDLILSVLCEFCLS